MARIHGKTKNGSHLMELRKAWLAQESAFDEWQRMQKLQDCKIGNWSFTIDYLFWQSDLDSITKWIVKIRAFFLDLVNCIDKAFFLDTFIWENLISWLGWFMESSGVPKVGLASQVEALLVSPDKVSSLQIIPLNLIHFVGIWSVCLFASKFRQSVPFANNSLILFHFMLLVCCFQSY